jgi:SAM-dependent methyltransferase
MQEKLQALREIAAEAPYKIIISKPAAKDARYHKIIVEKKKSYYQSAAYTEKQVFHENIQGEKLEGYLADLMEEQYLQLNAWSDDREYMLLISKKGKATYKVKKHAVAAPQESTEHNRKKKYLIEEGTAVAPLVDMGIFTAEGKVVRTMYDKFRQINRFLEIIEDGVKDYPYEHLNIIDFGCGKSYLTFVLYYYFTEVRKREVQIVGLDLKEDVIRNCNVAAEKYGYENLHFEIGDINGYQADFPVDMVVTLHACDTATDYALFNAIQWNAKMIFSVPCCQHELNQQMQTEDYSLMTRYGIVRERFAALTTDAIRANLLEYCGYKTQLLEFIDFAHTPKNILIRSVQKKVVPAAVKKNYLREVEQMMQEFHLQPTLYRLLAESGRIQDR